MVSTERRDLLLMLLHYRDQTMNFALHLLDKITINFLKLLFCGIRDMKGVWLMCYLRSLQLRLFRDLDALLNLKQRVCLSLLKAWHSRPQFIYRADKLCPFPKLKIHNDKSVMMLTFTIIRNVTCLRVIKKNSTIERQKFEVHEIFSFSRSIYFNGFFYWWFLQTYAVLASRDKGSYITIVS